MTTANSDGLNQPMREPQSEISICKVEVRATLVCFGDYEAVARIGRNPPDILHLRGVPFSVELHSAIDDSIETENHEIAFIRSGMVDGDWMEVKIGYPEDEDAIAAFKSAENGLYLADTDFEDLVSTHGDSVYLNSSNWCFLEEKRRLAWNMFRSVLSAPTAFPTIAEYEPASLSHRCEVVLGLFSRYQTASGNVRVDSNRSEWEGQLGYYFLRYPNLRTMFEKLLEDFPDRLPTLDRR